MPKLDTKLFPPLVALIFAVLMWLVAWLSPELPFNNGFMNFLGLIGVACGVGVIVWAVMTLKKLDTTISPTKIESTSTLVQNGPFKHSRNPMYLGLFLILLGWGLILNNGFAIAMTPIFTWYLSRYQISPEERALSEKYGEAYGQYADKVGRWI